MAQEPRIIDLRRSYLPMDPNVFPPTLHGTEGEDAPENRVPVIPYDGYNFMPTPQGYASFFGTNSSLGIDAATGNVDEVFTIQKATLVNLMVALKDDGIWTKDLASAGTWTHVITLTVPGAGVHKNWSKCIIDQALYVYRQGEASYWVASAANSYVFTAVVPTFLNMTGQLGIFKAGGRLGFWDSENSISWAALEDPQDFVASLETLAGNTVFQDIVGKITTVLQHGTGFLVYCTRSIVWVQRQVDSPMLFAGKAIFNNNGISYRGEACFGDPDTSHFAMTTTGFCEITNGQAQFVAAEASTYFKEQREPFYLQLVNGRYLFLQFLNPYYLQGRINFDIVNIPGTVFYFGPGFTAITGIDGTSVVSINNAVLTTDRAHESVFLFNSIAADSYDDASAPASVPIWEDHLVTYVSLAELAAYVASAPSTLGAPAYFAAKALKTSPTFGGTGPTINIFVNAGINNWAGKPSARSTSYSTLQSFRVEANEDNFFEKQNFLWKIESKYQQDFFAYVLSTFNTAFKTQAPSATYGCYLLGNSSGALVTGTCTRSLIMELEGIDYPAASAQTDTADSSIVDMTRVTNKTYNIDVSNNQWMQRNFNKGVWAKAIATPEVTAFHGSSTTVECKWFVDVQIYLNTATVASDALKTALALNIAALSAAFTNKIYSDLVSGVIAAITSWVAGTSGITSVTSVTFFEDTDNDVPSVYYADSAGGQRTLYGRRYVIKVIASTISGSGETLITYVPMDAGFTAVCYAPTTFNTQYVQKEPLLGGNPVFLRNLTTANLHLGDISFIDTVPDFSIGVRKQIGYSQITGHGHYTDPVTFVQDDATDEAPNNDDQYDPPVATTTTPTFNSIALTQDPWQDGIWAGEVNDITINGVTYTNSATPVAGSTITIPSGTILLQAGSIEPIYPTFLGAFVFDIHYKKWGKMSLSYKNLLDIYPINTMAGEQVFPYDSFLPKMGCRLTDGTFPIFDQYPTDAEIVFGKIGFYRKGFTDLEEIRTQHRTPLTGEIEIEASIDGRSVDATLTDTRPYTVAANTEEGFSLSARWYNVIVRGFFDLISLEFRGNRTGRR